MRAPCYTRSVLVRAFVAGVLLACSVSGCRREADERNDQAGQALGVLGQTPEFSLVDQAGKPVTRQSFQGKVWAAAFMFTRCPTICPAITRRMKSVQERAKGKGVPLELVSFSVDPDNDTPEVLAKYAAQYGASLDTWHFLTGPFDAMAKTAEQGFKIAVERRPGDEESGGIIHGSHLVLVDKSGAIRGYYRTTEDAAIDQLLGDAAQLAAR